MLTEPSGRGHQCSGQLDRIRLLFLRNLLQFYKLEL